MRTYCSPKLATLSCTAQTGAVQWILLSVSYMCLDVLEANKHVNIHQARVVHIHWLYEALVLRNPPIPSSKTKGMGLFRLTCKSILHLLNVRIEEGIRSYVPVYYRLLFYRPFTAGLRELLLRRMLREQISMYCERLSRLFGGRSCSYIHGMKDYRDMGE